MAELIVAAIGAVGFVAGWLRYMPRLKQYRRNHVRFRFSAEITVHTADGTEIMHLVLGRSDCTALPGGDNNTTA
ncbi:hypothetical protein [Nocardia mexicana]|uniref:Uncharacterized protein n=1 Tax=Nocardia mexicana TaxID=279262 RepID=A0A370HBY7_9NOCA|nr:hypothetical protein [Nocardia mexicana]RDI54011.1 hypothetical protein DFR68_102132 [Nocardia mexicana]